VPARIPAALRPRSHRLPRSAEDARLLHVRNGRPRGRPSLTSRRFSGRVSGHSGGTRIPRSGYRRWSVIPVLALGTGIGIVGIIVIIIIVVLVLRLR
jgi:uncharacterized membrane protein